MEFLVGLMLGVAVVLFAGIVGFDRERVFYPAVLIVVATYYVLFAAMGASGRTLVVESMVAGGFLLLAVLGFKNNPWIIVAALIGHGVFDFLHHLFIHNAGVPHWWPGFCLAFDATVGGLLAVRLMRGRLSGY